MGSASLFIMSIFSYSVFIQKLTFLYYDFIKALQIDSLVILAKESYLGFRNISLEEYYTTDTEVLEYRLAVMDDLVSDEKVFDCFCKAVNMIKNIPN